MAIFKISFVTFVPITNMLIRNQVVVVARDFLNSTYGPSGFPSFVVSLSEIIQQTFSSIPTYNLRFSLADSILCYAGSTAQTTLSTHDETP